MIIGSLVEIWRYTFPRNLRFCRQCQILHAQLAAVDKRYKDRKFIPRAELAGIIDSYVPGPPVAALRWPIVRNVCFIRGINTIRVWRGHPSWLYTGAVRAEHARIMQWFDKNATTLWIKRDRFKAEVLDEFKVAQQYHKFFLLGVATVTLVTAFVAAGAASEPLLYAFLTYWRGLGREGVRDFIAGVLEEHATMDTPERYKTVLPPAAFRLRKSSSSSSSSSPSSSAAAGAEESDTIYFNVVEMTSPTGNARVVFIPCPKVGHPAFYKQVGQICQNCSATLLEEIPLEYLHQMPPAFFFFPEEREKMAFPSLGLHHRVYDLIPEDQDTPPPKLLPGAVRPSTAIRYLLGMTPFSVKTLYHPYFLSGTKSEAKMAWGTLKSVIRGDGFFPVGIEQQLDARDAAKKRQQDAKAAVAGSSTSSSSSDGSTQSAGNGTSVFSAILGGGKNSAENRPSLLHLDGGNKTQRERETENVEQQQKSGQKEVPRRYSDPAGGPNYATEGAPQLDTQSPNMLTSERRIYPSIAVPWTVAQIANLEASMYRAGWTVTNQTSIEWLSPKDVGDEYYKYNQNRMSRSVVLDTIFGSAPASPTPPSLDRRT